VFISAAIKVEHFEIAPYRALVTGAQQMGQREVVNLLNENLREEETAQIAEQSTPELIQKAMRQEGQQEEEGEKGLIDKAKDKLMGE
jgi:ferritin-like metal-binding protein YciE